MHLGIDLGGTKTELVVLDGAGAERLRFRRPTPRGDYDATLALVADMVGEAEQTCGVAVSIGIGTPGAVVPASGAMKNCNSTWLNGRTLPADLRRRLDRDLRIANDADCFALSEAVDGAGAGHATVFGVILGTGVGGGIVHRRRLLAGPNALAGEWGHNPLPPLTAAPTDIRSLQDQRGDRACYCGRSNCVETWLSGPGLLRTWRELGGQADQASELSSALLRREPAAERALDLHGWQLAAALAVVINLLDPDVMVLGGGVSKLAPLYDVVPRRLGAFAFTDEVATPVLQALHGDASGVRGAAWLGRDAGSTEAEEE